MDERTLQALRNVTREHMRLLVETGRHTDSQVREVTCISEALKLLKQHNFKQDRPL